MKLTDDTEKIKIIERLVKEGAVDFTEALKLLGDPETITYYFPQPFINPWWPYDHQPWQITCESEVVSYPDYTINGVDGKITFREGLITGN